MPRTRQQKVKVKRTLWNLKPLFASDNDPRMEEKRKIVSRNRALPSSTRGRTGPITSKTPSS